MHHRTIRRAIHDVPRLRKWVPEEKRKQVIHSALLLDHKASCVYFGVRLFPNTMTVDHWHPRSRGGTDDYGNLVPACDGCNSRKADMFPVEFAFSGELHVLHELHTRH